MPTATSARLEPIRSLYPEVVAGGFSRVDGTIAFYGRVNACWRKLDQMWWSSTGRGVFLDDPVLARRDARHL